MTTKKAAKKAAKKSATKSAKKLAKQSAKKSAKKSSKKAGAVTPPAAPPKTGAGAGEAPRHLINVDMAKVWSDPGKERKFVTVLGWGDEVVVLNEETMEQDGHIKVRTTTFIAQSIGADQPEPRVGYIVPRKGSVKDIREVVVAKEQSRVLKVDFVDVQQGDGTVIMTPNDRTIVVDGGDNQMFARYLANRLNRFRQTSEAEPREIDCILVTHGDADHFAGLVRIFNSETFERLRDNQRLFIYPKRVYHNGLVKRPGDLPKEPGQKKAKGRPETQMLGPTATVHQDDRKVTVVTGLVNSLIDEGEVATTEMNEPFRQWREALKSYDERCLAQTSKRIEFRRLEFGTHDAFDFVNLDADGNQIEDEERRIKVEVLGPLMTESEGVRGLKFLGEPPHGPRLGDEVLDTETKVFKSASASHTINGHSVILRLTYGGFNFLFTGDLNDEAGRALADAHRRGRLDLNAEVFKVPHHGSADFSGAFLEAVSPLVSVVSAGDESARKEYIHPRATIMGALGKFGRGSEPLIFVTELVAFFEVVGPTWPEWHKMEKDVLVNDPKTGEVVLLSKARSKSFYAFRRTAFGLVRVRTDGKRLLVYTNSGQADLKEAYAYTVGRDGEPVPTPVKQV